MNQVSELNAADATASRESLPVPVASLDRLVTAEEKYCYARGGHLSMVAFGLVSSLLLLIGLCRFAILEAVLFVAVPFFVMNGLYLLLSYSVMLLRHSFKLPEHQDFIRQFCENPDCLRGVSVDVFVPVCGEPRETLLPAWEAIQQLEWPGQLHVWILDDSPTDQLQALAQEYGFHYLQRTGRELRKAGNLRHAFSQTQGDYILLLDADFAPRPEMLFELIPDLLSDSRLAVVQSPQFFNVSRTMNWVEAGAGFVQELFYRLIQPARDQLGAGVCVGSCAVYRRTALAEIGGTTPIDHSEDLWTGFELVDRGWRLKYIPVVLAKGLCPNQLQTFFSQQYRWCRGSLSLVLSHRFWTSRLNWRQKFCYVAGFAYYFATAFNAVLTPLPLVMMVALFPHWVHWNHLAFSILALIYTPFILCWWSVFPFGLHFLTTREVSGAAHLQALVDTITGRGKDWVVTRGEAGQRKGPQFAVPLGCVLGVSACSAFLIAACAALAIRHQPTRWHHFLPPLFFSLMHLAICWRALTGLQIGIVSGRKLVAMFISLLVLVSTVAVLWGPKSPPWQLSRDPYSSSRAHANLFSTRLDASFNPYRVENAFPGIEPRRIIRMRLHPQQANTYFLADFTGQISEVTRRGNTWKQRIIADLTGSDLGFLYSFILHPQYPADPRLFLAYRTRDEDALALRITSLEVPGNQWVDHRNEKLLIEQQVESTEHLGGDLAFDQEGCLLISCGDNQLSLQDARSQRLDGGLFSGILRIDIDQRGGSFSHAPRRTPEQAWTENYLIPNDNPWVGKTNALEEFWAIGLRNPFRMSFDAVERRLWIGDVGQDQREQVEVATAGSNHQWSFQEGTARFEKSYLNGEPPVELQGVSTPPFFEYPHDDLNQCIIGGEIYRGDKFPELQGRYLFGDNRSGRIWSIDPGNSQDRRLIVQLPFGKSASTLVSISTDSSGNIFFTNFASVPSVYRLALSSSMEFPAQLSEARLFQDLPTLKVVSELIPYEVTVPLWSDGLQKQRWFQLPPGQQIEKTKAGWHFPVGTLLVKHFSQGTDFSEPGRPVETRLLVVREDGSTAGATYLWNDAGTDADLQLERLDLPHHLRASVESFDYHLPGFHDCQVCHNRDNPVLGLNEAQLNLPVLAKDGLQQHQLVTLSERNVFDVPYQQEHLSQAKSLTRLNNAQASLELRARSYLHVNCSYCHYDEGIEHVDLNLDLFSSASVGSIVNAPAKLGYHRINGQYAKLLIDPGHLQNSAIYQRLQTEEQPFSMPYLGRTRPDQAALDVIAEWILSLPVRAP